MNKHLKIIGNFVFSAQSLPLWFLVGLSLFKFVNLGTGLVLGEPDEFIHARVAASFEQGWVPMDGENVWFYELPGYPFLAYLVHFLVGDYYTALRVVSAGAALLATLGVYWLASQLFDKESFKINRSVLANSSDARLKTERLHGAESGSKKGARALISKVTLRLKHIFVLNSWSNYRGLVVATMYALSPLVIFYSRIGMLDSALVAFSFLFILCLEVAIKKGSVSLGALSGLFLATAVLVKYSALIYVAVLGLALVARSIKATFAGLDDVGGLVKKVMDLEYLKLDPVTFAGGVIFGLLVGPIAFLCWRYDSWYFRQHLFTNLGFIVDFWRRAGSDLNVFSYFGSWVWWVSLPTGILFLLGIAPAIRDFRKFGVFWLSFVFTLLAIFRQAPFYPRYFLMLIPFVSVIAMYGFVLLWEITSWYFSFAKRLKSLTWNKSSYWQLLAVLLVLLVSSSVEAWRSSQHHLIEDASTYISQQSEQKNPWLFTNYWPHFFGERVPTSKATWLSDSPWETKAFVPNESRSALAILEQEGGFVVLESLYAYSPILISPQARTSAWEQIQKKHEPVEVVEDFSPNFPHFKVSYNTAIVYKITN